MYTWKDIKVITLQKMFAAEGSVIPNDESVKDYIAGMPGAANEALQMLATVGKFIIKTIDIAHNPVKNLLSDGAKIVSQERGTIKFSADGARSMYFECFGVGTYSVKIDDEEVVSGELTSKHGYSPYKAHIPNAYDKKVVLEITSSYPLAVKNVALYSADFESLEDIQPFSEKVRYNLRDLAPDFYALDSKSIYFEGDESNVRYLQTTDFFQEGDKVLVLDRDVPGNYKIYYKAYPQQITEDTLDSEVLSIDDEVAPLLPLYMASQLYKDDDNGIATSYRNEFEVAFERLKANNVSPSAERFTSESGWI